MVNLKEKTCQCTLWQRNQIPCKHAGRWTSFESFSEWWREQEAKDPKIDPPSKSADFESNFTDAKFKVRTARGQDKKKRRKKSTHGATRGPKKVKRITSAMDE